MQSIEIEFCHPVKRNENYFFTWELLDHEAAFIWFSLFCQCLSSEKVFFSRFTGFTGGEKDLNYLLASLNSCIDVINGDGRYHIKERAVEFTQEFSNIIHHHFEVLCGSTEVPTEYSDQSSPEVQKAVRGLNYFIHDLEAYTRNLGSGENACAGIILEVRKCDRFKIPSSLDRHFTMAIEPGDLVAHYSQIGKTWSEAFFDRDEIIFPEAIRPLYALSGEFDIMFGQLRTDEKFMADLNNFLKEKGLNPQDSSLRLGHLPLAKIKEKMSNKEYKEKLSYFNDIKSIKAFNNHICVAERFFSHSPSELF